MQLNYLLIFFLLLSHSLQEKKTKQKNRKPDYIEKDHYCSACLALVQEVIKKINTSKKESDIIYALDGICEKKNFLTYEFNPNELNHACEAFYDVLLNLQINNFAIELRRLDNSLVADSLCYKRTKACENVDLSEIRRQKKLKKARYEIDDNTGQILERIDIHSKIGLGGANSFDINNLKEQDQIEDL